MINIKETLIEKFSSNKTAKHNNLVGTGLIFILSSIILYLIDTTPIGELFLIYPINKFFRRNETDGLLDLSLTNKKLSSKEIISKGITNITREVKKNIPGMSNESETTDNIFIKNAPVFLSAVVLFIGYILVTIYFISFNPESIISIYMCPVLYSVSCVFFIAAYQNYNPTNSQKWLLCLLIGSGLLLLSIAIHILTRVRKKENLSNTDNEEEEEEENNNTK